MSDTPKTSVTSAEQKLSRAEEIVALSNHRIKNSLQMVSSIVNLTARDMDDPFLKKAMDAIQYRILALSVTHDQAYENTAEKQVNIAPILTRIADTLIRSLSFKGVNINATYSFETIEVETEKVSAICLAMAEMIVAAETSIGAISLKETRWFLSIRHAGSGYARLLLRYEFSAASNISAFPQKTSDVILDAIAVQLGGHYAHQTQDDQYEIQMDFPLNEKSPR